MQPDRIVHMGNSLVQHGPANDRVYLMKLDERDMPEIISEMERTARENGYSKLFAKVPATGVAWFAARGFVNEARVPHMHQGRNAGCFMSKYLDSERRKPADPDLLHDVLEVADSKAGSLGSQPDCSGVIPLGPDNAEEMGKLYGSVFKTYPFPIHEPEFICDSMASGTVFYGIREQGRLTAVASAEIDSTWKCAEMTDFATSPESRGNGAAGKILTCLEQDMLDRGIMTAYTIARAGSHGMNIVFSRAGYNFAGTLVNNTQIGGTLESMNVWYKPLNPG